MIDEEVEIVLREIRERVHSTPPPRDTTPDVVPSAQESRNDHELIAPDEASENLRQALARLNSYLTTTARAWDRLPPVIAAEVDCWHVSSCRLNLVLSH